MLEQPRRPWLDPETLKQKFLSLSASVHPDRVHERSESEKRAAHDRYTQLNSAYQLLREPRDRLRHLLELELGSRPAEVQQVPAQLIERFMEISRISRDADAALREQTAITSPMLKLQFFERAQGWIEKLNAIQQQLTLEQNHLLTEVKTIDEQWGALPAAAEARRPLLERLEQIHPLLAFYNRWTGQLQERSFRFSL